jgi:hypothetical protein
VYTDGVALHTNGGTINAFNGSVADQPRNASPYITCVGDQGIWSRTWHEFTSGKISTISEPLADETYATFDCEFFRSRVG